MELLEQTFIGLKEESTFLKKKKKEWDFFFFHLSSLQTTNKVFSAVILA